MNVVNSQGSKLAAGYDLYSAYDYVVPAGGKVMAKTDIQVSITSSGFTEKKKVKCFIFFNA